MEKKIRGAIWSHFFRLFPTATSLSVESVGVGSEGKGSAILSLQRDYQRQRLEVLWEMDEDELTISCPILPTN